MNRLVCALYRFSISIVLLAFALSGSAQEEPKQKPQGAQLPTTPGSQPGPAHATGPGQYPEALFKGMKWRVVGPFRGGRVLAVAGIPGDPSTYYFGAVAGGVFKSTNAGATWQPMFEHEHVSSIGAIAVSESNPNVVYAGSGEACIRGNISYGDGVYKSVDGGNNWKNVGLRDSRHIGALAIDPRNSDRVFVAALGHAFGANPERGVFRTVDGGATWQKVLYVDDRTGAIDVVFDPNNPNILFASMWQVLRQPWNLSSGGPGSGLYKSIDGGSTWKRLERNGLPEGIMGRIGVTVSGADSNRVYAQIEAKDGGLYRSDDAGEHWTRVNDDDRYRQRAWYFTHVFADPKSVDTLYMLNTGLFRSTDGGKTFGLLPAPHGDHHGLWIDPKDPNRIFNGNDGGVTLTVDGGKTWTPQTNQPTAQFYHVIADNQFPYYLYGAQQDNTTVAIASQNPNGETEGAGVIGREWWYDVGGGESGYIAPDPRDANIVYSGDNGGLLARFDKRTGQEQLISVLPLDVSGHGASDIEHRFQWTEPV
ncbi:MAG: glycosyl hydrolase, partial [Acidobacteria bacterium]|nr:glycosyl hydrolase [Acidobacteriota bacterium]